MGSQLIRIIYKNNYGYNNEGYLFISSDDVKQGDIVLAKSSNGRIGLAICILDHVDVSSIRNPEVAFKLIDTDARFVCRSSHDISSSRNEALKSMLAIFDVSINELRQAYDSFYNLDEYLENGNELPY